MLVVDKDEIEPGARQETGSFRRTQGGVDTDDRLTGRKTLFDCVDFHGSSLIRIFQNQTG
jgi:hypothetical protein